ncbi:hypothetical protein [Pectobacterium polaris]|uniref:hypothetical protein n=1 Tax=Pectobacterium polaris TaxID=2042057 RepID=UPI001F296960|nr:hypothetical protein [Pectobacterium polaris]
MAESVLLFVYVAGGIAPPVAIFQRVTLTALLFLTISLQIVSAILYQGGYNDDRFFVLHPMSIDCCSSQLWRGVGSKAMFNYVKVNKTISAFFDGDL